MDRFWVKSAHGDSRNDIDGQEVRIRDWDYMEQIDEPGSTDSTRLLCYIVWDEETRMWRGV
ncbi:unnamed protein product, partial [marine sediment metagenome]